MKAALFIALGILLMIYTILYQNNKCYNLAKNAILQIAERRHSGKHFDPTKIVNLSKIASIFSVAQLTPSSYNEQPWRCFIYDKTINKKNYKKIFSTLTEHNKQWAKNAQILIVIAASLKTNRNETNRWAEYDTGAAALSMEFQATALGLMTHQIGGFDREQLARSMSLPKDIIPLSIMALGYEDVKSDSIIAHERNSLETNFFLA